MFDLKNISYSYEGGGRALDGISLLIEKGTSVALTGDNGCGKTTLLRVLNGLVFPTKGEYLFEGKAIDKRTFKDTKFVKSFHQRIGFVFQNADAQLFCGSVDDEIAFGPRQMEKSETECRQRVDDCLKLLNIEHLRTRAPYATSGGEKRKIAFACVLALNPDALVMDEPLAGLDVMSQQLIINLLKDLRAAKKTLIFATHNESLVKSIADVRVRMANGKVVGVEKVVAD